MESNIKTEKIEIVFDEIEFPLISSENIRRFFYPEFLFVNPDEIIEYEQFCDILNGNDKSKNAHLVLERLLDPRYNRLPPKSFDIIIDEIENKEYIDSPSRQIRISGERHTGVCTLDGVLFDFDYYVDFHNSRLTKKDGTIIGHKIIRWKSKVKLQGDTKEYINTYMHKACQNYFLHKKYNFDEFLIQEKIKEEKEKWRKAIQEHKLELIDYLKNHSWPCKRIEWRFKKGIINYEEFRYLEYGKCQLGGYCHNDCYVTKGQMNEYGEHDDFWFNIGLDKLDLKFLD